MFQMAHTLYEISPSDLQMLAGKEVIEGKRSRASDYLKSKRKIRKWAKQEPALMGVSCMLAAIFVLLSHLVSFIVQSWRHRSRIIYEMRCSCT